MTRLMLAGLALALTACADAGAPQPANQAANAEAPAELAAAKAESIPARFRGVWAADRAACAQQAHPSRLIISERVIRYPSLVLVSEAVDLPSGAGFAVRGYSQRTGAPAEAQFSIDATGGLLTEETGGGAVRARCG